LNQIQNQTKKAQNIPSFHHDLIKMILKETDQSLKGKIKNPYSDIIDLVI
jgi:hypothetical protein